MKLIFEAPKGILCHRYFRSVFTPGFTWITPQNKWISSNEFYLNREQLIKDGMEFSSNHSNDVRTLKAFKRMLRKNTGIVGSAILVSHYSYVCPKTGKEYSLDVRTLK